MRIDKRLAALGFLLGGLCLNAGLRAGETVHADVLDYLEQEPGTEVYPARILVTPDYLRIDEGGADDDFLLFDRAAETLYSVTHGDSHILVLPPQPGLGEPPAGLDLEIEKRPVKAAPKVGGREVLRVIARAGGETCQDAHVVPGLLPEASAALGDYARLLGRRAASNLSSTPKELRTPCFLANYVYATDAAHAAGLVIESHQSKGRMRQLQAFHPDQEVDAGLFELPEGYGRTVWSPPE